MDSISAEKLADYREAFGFINQTGSGGATIEEFTELCHSAGITTDQQIIEAIFHEIDDDGNGTVEFEEFVDFVERASKEEDRMGSYTKIFSMLDPDGAGAIPCDRFRDALVGPGRPLTRAEFDEVFGEIDRNGDGEIDFDEFVALMDP